MSPVTYEAREGGLALVRLDRPAARNAMNTALLEALLAHLATAAGDEAVKAVVLSSTDQEAFSAGADLREELDRDAAAARMQLFADVYDVLTAFPKPTVVACHGAVVGGGAEVAVACDLRVAGDNLRLRFPGAALGVPVGPARLVTLCGLSVAKDLLLTSRTVTAQEAHRWGLVHRVVPAAEAEAAALALAAEVAAHPAESVARIKRMLHEHDGVVERSRSEGVGQVEWQRSGPGLPFGVRR